MRKIIYAVLCGLFVSVLSSCGSEVLIKVTPSGADFDFFLSLDNSGLDYVQSLSAEDTRINADAGIFDTDGIKINLISAGIDNVTVKNLSPASLRITGSLNRGAGSAIFDSGIIEFSHDKSVKVVVSSETLKGLYNNLPYGLKSYVDMLAAPSFTGEQMTDGEYTELVGAIYGDELAGEIKSAKMKFIIQDADGNRKVRQIPVLKLLNIVGKLEI